MYPIVLGVLYIMRVLCSSLATRSFYMPVDIQHILPSVRVIMCMCCDPRNALITPYTRR